MRFIRFALLIALFIVAVPTFAQDDAPPIDPEGEFTEVYTLENITVNYPTGMVVTDVNGQITLTFDGNNTDYITIATPAGFEFFSIPNDTFEIASQAVFEIFSGVSVEAVTYEESVTETTLVGLPATYFELVADGYLIFAYTILIGEDIYAVTLLTEEVVLPAEDELVVLEKIVASMTIDGELVAIEPEPVATEEATEEATAEAEATDEPVAGVDILERENPPRLDERFTQEVSLFEGTLTIRIPEAWVILENGVATAEGAFPAMNNDMDAFGEDDLVIQFLDPALAQQLTAEDQEITPLAITEFIATDSAFTESVIYTYPDMEREIYYVDVVGEDAPEGAFFFILGLDDAGTVLILGGVASDFDAQEALIFAVLDTLVYTPAGE